METFPWSFLLSINNCGLSCGSMLKPELAGRQLPRKVIGSAGTGLPSCPQQGYRDIGASPGGSKVPQMAGGANVHHVSTRDLAGCACCVQPPHIPAVQPYAGPQNQVLGAEPHVWLSGESPASCVLALQDLLGVCFLPDSLSGAVLHPPHHILHQPWVGAPRPVWLLSGSPMGPAQQGWGVSSSRSVPHGGSAGCGYWWPGCHLPQQPRWAQFAAASWGALLFPLQGAEGLQEPTPTWG